jgi:molybdopterin-guanine dinucleotide biosynthesis protein A
MPKASVIIRTRNEERWIKSCLESVFSQDFTDFEAILVDNQSRDRTREIARKFDVRVVSYSDEYLPGRALNAGIRQSKGELLVMLSGHCIPTNPKWLGAILQHFGDEKLAGVYGRQEPLPFTADRDKRDLWTVFQMDRKIQTKDCFFHNSNSAIRRDLWEKEPFSETATNIEDRIWAKEMLAQGYHLIYEPEASVYHWHGIHQNDNAERRRNVVGIIESLKLTGVSVTEREFPDRRQEIVAIIPVRGESPHVGDKSLLAFTIERALASRLVTRVIVSTDHPRTQQLAIDLGAEAPFLRPPELSFDYVGVDQVVEHAVHHLQHDGYFPDWVLTLKESHPFRRQNFLDNLIRQAVESGKDVLVPVRKNLGAIYHKESEGVEAIQEESVPAGMSDPFYLGNIGLGKIVQSRMFADPDEAMETGIYVVSDQVASLMIRNQQEADELGPILKEFWLQEAMLNSQTVEPSTA